MTDLLTPKQTAEMLGLSTWSVYKMIGGPDPLIPSVRVGLSGRSNRVSKAALEAWIARQGEAQARPGGHQRGDDNAD